MDLSWKTSLASAVERARLSPSASSRPRSLSMRNLSRGQTGSARRNSLPMPKTADDAVLTSRGPKAEAIMEAAQREGARRRTRSRPSRW